MAYQEYMNFVNVAISQSRNADKPGFVALGAIFLALGAAFALPLGSFVLSYGTMPITAGACFLAPLLGFGVLYIGTRDRQSCLRMTLLGQATALALFWILHVPFGHSKPMFASGWVIYQCMSLVSGLVISMHGVAHLWSRLAVLSRPTAVLCGAGMGLSSLVATASVATGLNVFALGAADWPRQGVGDILLSYAVRPTCWIVALGWAPALGMGLIQGALFAKNTQRQD